MGLWLGGRDALVLFGVKVMIWLCTVLFRLVISVMTKFEFIFVNLSH